MDMSENEAEERMRYAHRPKPFAAELDLTLTHHHLTAERGKSRQIIPLAGIERITLTFSPRNIARLAFTCHIRATDGRSVKFDTISWKSLTDVDRQDEAYRAFITALITRARAVNPGIIFHAGLANWRFRAMLVMGILLGLAMAGAGVNAAQNGNMPIALFGFGLAAYLAWWLRDYLTRNRPTPFTAEAVPPGVLP
jgi:hypothetical protein